MKLFLTIIFSFLTHGLFATEQEPDLLLFKGDTIPIYKFPLAGLLEKDSILPSKIKSTQDCISTDCWRGYIGIWMIENDSLFLIALKDCCENNQIPLTEIFNKNRLNEGKVFASWYTDSITSGFGTVIKFNEEKWESEYEHQIAFQFKNGRVSEMRITKK